MKSYSRSLLMGSAVVTALAVGILGISSAAYAAPSYPKAVQAPATVSAICAEGAVAGVIPYAVSTDHVTGSTGNDVIRYSVSLGYAGTNSSTEAEFFINGQSIGVATGIDHGFGTILTFDAPVPEASAISSIAFTVTTPDGQVYSDSTGELNCM